MLKSCFQSGKLRFRRRDIFITGSFVCQRQCGLRIFQIGRRRFPSCFRIIGALPAYRTVGKKRCHTLIISAGIIFRGCQRFRLRCRLGNFFRTGTVVQLCHHRFLLGNHRLLLGNRQLQRTGIQPRQHIACLHRIAFLFQHFLDPPIAVESKRNLTNIYISVKDQFSLFCIPALIKEISRSKGDHQNHGNDDRFPVPLQPFHFQVSFLPERCPFMNSILFSMVSNSNLNYKFTLEESRLPDFHLLHNFSE